MARIRMIKPEFFDDPDIADLSLAARLLFIGLWLQADREGRYREDCRRLKARVFPYDDVSVQNLLTELDQKGLIARYQDSAGTILGWVRSFTKHQRPHHKEADSQLEAFTEDKRITPSKVGARHVKARNDPPESGEWDTENGSWSLESGGLENGKHTQNPKPMSVSGNGNGEIKPTDDARGQEAAVFLERYVELYAKHRNGARYHVKPSLDWSRVCNLLNTYPLNRLEKLAAVLLTTDEDWVQKTDRGIGVLVARASWCDDRLSAWEAANGVKA